MRQPGLIVAPLTPFTADLKVDERSSAPANRLRGARLRGHHGGRGRRGDAGIHLSELRSPQGADPLDHRIRRRPRAGDGRHHPSVVSHRHRACARGRAAWRRRPAAVGAAAAVRRSADAARSPGVFRSDRARDPSAADALSQSRPGRGGVDPRYHCAGQAAARAIHQGEFTRPRAGVAADCRNRPRRPRAIFHHNADAAGEPRTWRLGRHHAAAGGWKSPAM